MFVYQPTLNILELKEDKSTEYVNGCKSKRIHTYKCKSWYTGFLQSIKFSGYKMRIKFNQDPLTVEKIITQPKL